MRNLGASHLSAGLVAVRLGVTPRYVHLLLEETGRNFSPHHVLERRLEKAAALLRDPRLRHRKVADIAAEAGFNDLLDFNRAFRRHFCATPRTSARRPVTRSASSARFFNSCLHPARGFSISRPIFCLKVKRGFCF